MRNRNIILLSFGQAMALAGPPVVVLLGGILGMQLAPSPSLATLPISAMVIGVALFTIPASFFMRRFGRRVGFSLSSLMASLACLLAAYAVATNQFSAFCLAALIVGANGAFVQQYRFAATESVDPEYAGRAASFVLLGGIVGGFAGPGLAVLAKGWLPTQTYVGSFLVIAALYALASAALAFMIDVAVEEQVVDETGRGLRELVSQRLYLVAVLAGAVGYGVMSFIMTATPIQLHELHGYDLDQTALVIQGHIAAMYAPSLFTGFLMDRLGEVRVILMGLVAMFAAVALNVAGVDLAHYGAGLVLLGVGWNFLFIGGTVLLTRTYQPSERFRAQAANDFVVFGVTAAASLSAGAVLLPIGWDALNLVVVPFLLTVLAGVIAIRGDAYRKAVGEDAVVVST